MKIQSIKITLLKNNKVIFIMLVSKFTTLSQCFLFLTNHSNWQDEIQKFIFFCWNNHAR